MFGTLYLIGGLDASGATSGRNDAFSPDRLLRITQRQPSISVTGGTFAYDKQPHAATATATGRSARVPVPGSLTFNYSPGGSTPVTPGFYSVNATFTSA